MEVFVARQPILTKNEEVYAYELLYRNNEKNQFSNIDGDVATTDVLINSFFTIGIDQLSEGKPCFINFTENLLKKGVATYFPPEMIVIEILETVEITSEIVEICKQLKYKGYKIALDDFVYDQLSLVSENMYQLVDIIKIDIRQTNRAKRKKMLQQLRPYQIDFLAEKVETREEYEMCLFDGFVFFQGYFFCKPAVIRSRDVDAFSSIYVEILYELSQKDPNVDRISEMIERDVALSYKLIKLINSSTFHLITSIQSIKHAIMLLGLDEIKKWIYLLAFQNGQRSSQQVIDEAIKMCLIRAKTCEYIGSYSQMKKMKSSYFLVGMFSLMDMILMKPLPDVIKDLPLEPSIKAALLGEENTYKPVLDAAIALEKGDWPTIDEVAFTLNVSPATLFDAYTHAVKDVQKIISQFIL
ncbi:EAL and HDOD domain-containing protein [Halalkalibacter sp. AB-rgal2]|uniref:EAL and HDOD domain-containing protein n=1 Tax=Halalkalibacter sp. AB-rgal2 TaxID=3242695 RepID=UPI00359E88D4